MILTTNQRAFLAMLGHSEGTDLEPEPYRVCFQGEDPVTRVKLPRHIVQDMSDHPAVTGEWMGESLAFLGAGYEHLVSTAAGAYQLIKPTWLACKRQLGLKNFEGDAQDAAALLLIDQKGATALIESGRISEAIAAVANLWASLPGGTSGQPENKLIALVNVFKGAGGSVA